MVFSTSFQLVQRHADLRKAMNAAPLCKACCTKVICFPRVGLTRLDRHWPRPQTPQGGVEMKLSNSLTRFSKNQEIVSNKETCISEGTSSFQTHVLFCAYFNNETRNNFRGEWTRLVVLLKESSPAVCSLELCGTSSFPH